MANCELSATRGDGFRKHVNPQLATLLERLGMDRCFVRGHGSYLFDEAGVRYLDAVAGYGAVPFGHTPGEVWRALRNVEETAEPVMVQPSVLSGAGDLAEALVRIAPPGLCHVTFANSGTEAVEAGIKAARLSTGRLGVVATENGFHGKTLGALSATGREFYQQGTGAPAEGFTFVPFGDVNALAEVFALRAKGTAAFIVESIQGEGGVVEAPAGYLKLVLWPPPSSEPRRPWAAY